MNPNLTIPREAIADFCRRNRIRKLALFGSALREDFRPDSDVDVLVEFEPGSRVGLIRPAGMEPAGPPCPSDQTQNIVFPSGISSVVGWPW